MNLKVVGILKLREGISYGALDPGFLYSEATAREMIRRNIDSKINQYIRNEIDKIVEEKGGNKYSISLSSKISYDLKCYWESIDQETGEIHPFGNRTDAERDTYEVRVGQTDSTTNLTSFFLADSESYNNFDIDSYSSFYLPSF